MAHRRPDTPFLPISWLVPGGTSLRLGAAAGRWARGRSLGAVMLSLVTTIALLVMVIPRLHVPRQGLCPLLHLSGSVQQLDAVADHQPNLLEIYVFWSLWACFLPARRFLVRPRRCSRRESLVVNRVGDFGLLGILGVLGHRQFRFPGHRRWSATGSRQRQRRPMGRLLLCLLVFMGPMAKSASSLCTSGCRMPWRARRRFPP